MPNLNPEDTEFLSTQPLPMFISGSWTGAVGEEIFGPVAYAMTFNDQDKVIDLMKSSSYGLANSVWSSNLERANRVAERLVAGNSWINAHNLFAHGMPYAGCNLSGCGGGVLGPETLSDYLRNQTVARPLT